MTFVVEYNHYNIKTTKVEAKTAWEAANKSTLLVADKLTMISRKIIVEVSVVGSRVKELFKFTEDGEFEKI